MMVLKIEKELKKLEEFTEILSVASTYEEDVFIGDPIVHGGAERFILQGLASVLKVGKLVAEENDSKNLSTPKDVLETLRNNKVYPEWLCDNLSKKIKYIDILDYDYLRHMDKEEIYDSLDEFISDFRHFKKFVLEYVI